MIELDISPLLANTVYGFLMSILYFAKIQAQDLSIVKCGAGDSPLERRQPLSGTARVNPPGQPFVSAFQFLNAASAKTPNYSTPLLYSGSQTSSVQLRLHHLSNFNAMSTSRPSYVSSEESSSSSRTPLLTADALAESGDGDKM